MVASLDGGGQRLPSLTRDEMRQKKEKNKSTVDISSFYLLEEVVLLNVSLTK
jgi:hypothetical protein